MSRLTVLCLACLLVACTRAPVPRASYDPFTRSLTRLDMDTNHNGRVDQWTYVQGGVLLRSEMDVDENGRIDRWEYVTPEGDVLRIGAASRADGVEDRWTLPATAAGEQLVERSSGRARHIDRREYFVGGELRRAEEDSDEDGAADKWEEYAGGRLRRLWLDTTLARGRSDRRLDYDGRGALAGIAKDDDGDGHFEPVGQRR